MCQASKISSAQRRIVRGIPGTAGMLDEFLRRAAAGATSTAPPARQQADHQAELDELMPPERAAAGRQIARRDQLAAAAATRVEIALRITRQATAVDWPCPHCRVLRGRSLIRPSRRRRSTARRTSSATPLIRREWSCAGPGWRAVWLFAHVGSSRGRLANDAPFLSSCSNASGTVA